MPYFPMSIVFLLLFFSLSSFLLSSLFSSLKHFFFILSISENGQIKGNGSITLLIGLGLAELLFDQF